jgi:hypothetical protein
MAARPQQIYPAQGGILASSASPDQVGPANYTVKRDFRRELGSEHRREGCAPYWANRILPIGGQPTPSTRYLPLEPAIATESGDKYTLVEGTIYKFIPGVGEVLVHNGTTYDSETIFTASATDGVVVRTLDDDSTSTSRIYEVAQENDPDDINLITKAVRPNGDTAIIVGTPTTLYRQMVFEDPRVYEDDVYASSGNGTPVYSIYNGDWAVIGSGFSAGLRWQWVNIDGYLALNNGVDLPVTFRVEDTQVKPIYELRENSVASVGSISSLNDVLFCGDIRQLTEDGISEIMLPVGFGVTEIRFISNSGSGAVASVTIVMDQIGSINVLNGGGGYAEAPEVEVGYPDGAEGVEATAVIAGSPIDNIVLESGGSGFSVAPTVTISGGGGSGATATATIVGSRLLTIAISNQGSNYVSPPAVEITGGGGSGAEAVSYIDDDGKVTRIEITNYGEGYTSAPTVTLRAGQEGGGDMATATAVITSTAISEINLTDPGSDYINAPEVEITGDGTGAKAIAILNDDGTVQKITILDGGTGYTTATITITPDAGTGAAATATTLGGSVSQITLTNPGSGYLSAPSVSFTGDGSGAVAKAQTRGGYVTSVALVSGGSGFKAASQTGSVVSGEVVGSMASGDPTFTASSASFNGGSGFTSGMLGSTLKIDDGFYAIITAVTDSTHVELADAPTYDITNQTFSVVNDLSTADRTVTSTTPFFTADMVGQDILWVDGNTRTILAFTSSTEVVVDYDRPVPQGEFSVSNRHQYAPVTDTSLLDRYIYRTLWSNRSPRDFGATLYGDIEAGSSRIRLTYPARSLAAGDQILIDSAGINGGNLTTTIVAIEDGGVDLLLSDTASTSVEGATIRKVTAIGGITGFQDLMDGDGSGISTMLGLQDSLIIYKASSIFSCRYTGRVSEPFQFRREYLGPDTPSYRNAVMDFGSFHLYPSSNAFFRYDLGGRLPVYDQEINASKNLFFDEAKPANEARIWTANNDPTRECFLVFPSTTSDKALVIDTDTMRMGTTGMTITAAATLFSNDDPVAQFVMATPGGMLTTYLRRDKPSESVGTVSQAGYVLTGSGFTQEHVGYTLKFANGTRRTIKSVASDTSAEALENGTVAAQAAVVQFVGYHRNFTAYTSTIESGLNGWGDSFNEKDLEDYVLLFGPASNCLASVEFFTARNVGEDPSLVGLAVLNQRQNAIPTAFQFHYIKDRIEVTGTANPCEITGRVYNVDGVRSESATRHI